MAENDQDKPLADEDLARIVEHLEGEEESSREAALSSQESFLNWLSTRVPPTLMETFAIQGPALYQAVLRLFGA